MFCKYCGAELENQDKFCHYCGCDVGKGSIPTPLVEVPVENQKLDISVLILGVLVPPLGLIFYLIWKDSEPLKAKSIIRGVGIGAIFYAFCFILFIVFFERMFNSYYWEHGYHYGYTFLRSLL